MYRSLCKTAQAAFLLFILVSDFEENQRTDYEKNQTDANDCFKLHYSSSSFFLFLNVINPIVAAPTAETPINTSQRAGLRSSPVFGVSLSSLCIVTMVVEPSFMVAWQDRCRD